MLAEQQCSPTSKLWLLSFKAPKAAVAGFYWEPRMCFYFLTFAQRVHRAPMTSDTVTNLCLLTPQVSHRLRAKEAELGRRSKRKLAGKCDRCGGLCQWESESRTVRHVDSGVVMDGEWGKMDDIVCLKPCCHSGGLPLVLTSQYQRANWSLFTLLQWSDLRGGLGGV